METKRVIEKTIEYKSLKSCQLIWELVKMNVKDYTISYCKNKAQDRTRATRSIQKDLDTVNENILNLEVKEHISNEEIIKLNNLQVKQAISAHERALCQLTVCFEFQSRSDRRKKHKSCALEMVFGRKLRR